MKIKSTLLWRQEEYKFPALGGFIPTITSYIHKDNRARPALIIVPGGGYNSVAPGEGEIVAKTFYYKDYQTFVVTYTTNPFGTQPLKMQPLMDLSRAILHVRKHENDYHIQPQNVALCGFSAGGHLAGCLAVHYADKTLEASVEAEGVSNRPNALILSYPVITSGKFAHKESFETLLGSEVTDEELAWMSIEKHVKKSTPPTFLWHCADDTSVPVENSLLFADVCKQNGVPVELHVFQSGSHGMSVATDELEGENYGGYYTLYQMYTSLKFAVKNNIDISYPLQDYDSLKTYDDFIREMKMIISLHAPERKTDAAIALWPMLADLFLKKSWTEKNPPVFP